MFFLVNPCSANGSDSKKQRLDESPPSRVLHIRKLPNEVTETEVIALGLPFGKVTNILMLKGKNQVGPKTEQMNTGFSIWGSCLKEWRFDVVLLLPGISRVRYRGSSYYYGELLHSCDATGLNLLLQLYFSHLLTCYLVRYFCWSILGQKHSCLHPVF